VVRPLRAKTDRSPAHEVQLVAADHLRLDPPPGVVPEVERVLRALDDAGATLDAALVVREVHLARVGALLEAGLGADLPAGVHPDAAVEVERDPPATRLEVAPRLDRGGARVVEGEQAREPEARERPGDERRAAPPAEPDRERGEQGRTGGDERAARTGDAVVDEEDREGEPRGERGQGEAPGRPEGKAAQGQQERRGDPPGGRHLEPLRDAEAHAPHVVRLLPAPLEVAREVRGVDRAEAHRPAAASLHLATGDPRRGELGQDRPAMAHASLDARGLERGNHLVRGQEAARRGAPDVDAARGSDHHPGVDAGERAQQPTHGEVVVPGHQDGALRTRLAHAAETRLRRPGNQSERRLEQVEGEVARPDHCARSATTRA
jgi:hypothetical protein